jgi:hypothetical protein
MLQPLGIEPEAEALYRRLVRLKRATPTILSEGEPLEQIIKKLEALAQLGLVASESDDAWRAVPLPNALRALRERRLAEMDSAVAAADAVYTRLVAESEPDTDGVRAIIGREDVQATMNLIADRARVELCAFDKPPYVTDRAPTIDWLEQNSAEWNALTRGVRIRGVYHAGFDKERLLEMSLFIQHGEQARTGDVPMKLVLVDGETALIPSPVSYSGGQEVRATVVRHPIMVEALQSLFDAVWDRSLAIVVSDGQVMRDPRRNLLVEMLMTGTTDVAIASQMGVTERSVRRWIAELMAELEVQTRLQLGAALARTAALNDAMGESSRTPLG